MSNEIKQLAPLSEKAELVLGFLKSNEGFYTVAEINENIEGTELKDGSTYAATSTQAILTSLVNPKRGLVIKGDEKVSREVSDKDGNKVTRQYFAYSIA